MKVFSLLALIALGVSRGEQSGPDVPFTVSCLFSDGVIVQRNAIVPVWGTAPSGTSVAISFDGVLLEVEAGPGGTWRGALEPHPAGGPHTLTISAGDSRLEIQDVWFGDVWIASGQSNMEWVVADAADAENEIRSGNDPLIRHFKVPRSWSSEPQPTLAGGEWHPADSEHVGAFSAVGYYFARELREAVDVPIGIINSSWGGSRIEPWIDRETLNMDRDQLTEILDENRRQIETLEQRFRDQYGASSAEDPGLRDSVAVWADPDLDTTDWDDIVVPGNWEARGYPGLDGVAWYRTEVGLTSEQVDVGPATLHLDTIDDDDMTWINGTLVGKTWGWTIPRTYSVPAGILRPGRNTIAIRVQDGQGGGGIYGAEEELRLEAGSFKIPLSGSWKFRVGTFMLNHEGTANQLPTLLYNKMIFPMLQYPVKGFIWYQGESNAGSEEDALTYADLFKSMITSWRTAWDNESAPFLFVSLANFLAASDDPGAHSNWAVLRESQAAALSLHNVGQAITIDVGDAEDIHPRNKQDVGRRLALAARHLAYGEDLVYSGPVYRSHRVDGGRMVITFDHVGSGLVARGDQLKGFAIGGADGRFVWADARIDGSTVVVSSPSVRSPTAVRYAWADNPENANLYNKEGLPAAPFRTGP